MTRFFNLLAIALFIEAASAFAPTAATSQHSTAVHLVPEDGRQLVAFSQDYLSKKAKESASKASTLTSSRRRQISADGPRSKGMAASARNLMTRLLGVEEKARTDTESNLLHHHSDDEVMYPIVGFNLVDGHAVFTSGQQAACDLHLPNEGKEEEAFGFWTSLW